MISVVTVSWNSHLDIEKLLSQLDTETASSELEFVVVDNNSASSSQSALRKLKAKFIKLKVFFNEENVGFGRACNAGVKESRGEVILFLNPDTAVDVKTVLKAGSRINGTSEFDILGVQQLSDLGVSRTCCRKLTRVNTFISCSGINKISKFFFRGFEMLEWDHLQSRNVGHVIGAFYCMKRSAFEALNGFDEKFFLYYEDLDLSLRAIKAGMKIYFDSNIKIYHKGGGSSEKIGTRRIEYSLISRDLMIGKHFGLVQQSLCRIASCFIEFPLRILKSVIQFNFTDISSFAKIYWKLFWLPVGANK